MSEQGWRQFLAAKGVDDWVVLHGGASAVFRVPSLGAAAQLAAAVAQVPGVEHSGALMTIADDRLTVRLTRGILQLERRHLDLARGISAVGRKHGAVADRAGAQEVQLAIAAKPGDARRRVCRSRSRGGARGGGAGHRRTCGGRIWCPCALDTQRSRRQPRVHLRLARRRHVACSR